MNNTDKRYDAVYALLSLIPRGKVVSYGQLARRTGLNPRQVGRVLHKNPNPDTHPCHRVVRSDGKIASGYAFGGPDKQISKLRSEGVTIDKSRVKDFAEYRYDL